MPSSFGTRVWVRGLAARSSISFRASAGCRGGFLGRGRSPSHSRLDRRVSCLVAFSSHTAPAELPPSPSSNEFFEEEHKPPTAQNNDTPVVILEEVSSDGTLVTLRFHGDGNNEGESAESRRCTYHASWLWSNDPRRVVLPSGQRKSTPGQYWRSGARPRIKCATIVYCSIEPTGGGGNENDGVHGNFHESTSGSQEDVLASERISVPGPTLEDCCHPLAIYGNYPAWITATALANDVFRTEKGKLVRPYLRIAWSTSLESTLQVGHHELSSIYDVEWLKRFQYENAPRLHHKRMAEVQPMHAIRKEGPPLWYSTPASETELAYLYPVDDAPKHGDDGLLHIDYHSIIDRGGNVIHEGLFRLLHSVFCDGAALVFNTPMSATINDISGLCRAVESAEEDELPVAKVARAMSGGALSHGNLYGNIFHVRIGERGSNNVAYTSNALCPHQDLAYYESPPGMQLLHCVAMGRGVVGGESTLVDAMAAAHRLRQVRPRSFGRLVGCLATFVKQRNGACMTYRRPHIVLAAEDGEGDVEKNITAVFWSPPFEGPVLLPPGQVDGYYEAYADFERMLNDAVNVDKAVGDELSQYASEYTWEHKLNPGEMLVFNNRRMVHGRRGFSAAEGASFDESQRHLVGCYTNIDDTLNSYRVLLRERGASTSILNPGNSSNVFP